MNNIILETGNPDNAKLVVEFEYLDTVNNFVDEDIFYAEEIEVKEEQVTGTTTVEQYSPNCLYQSLEVQNEVIIEKDSSICESNSYEQAIKNLNSKLETPKISAKKTKKKKRKRSCSEDEWKLGEQTTFAKSGSIEVKPPLVPTPLKSFFGSSLGVSKCHICNKFTKRSCFEAHVQEHFQNGKKRKVEDASFEEENDEINSLYDSSKQESLDEVFRCYLCSFVTNSQSTLEDHSESHAENKPVICTLCNFSCEDHKDMEAHMETHSDYSDSFVDDKSNDLYAIQKQNGDKAFKCNLCGFKSFQVSAYKTHIKKHVKVHTGENPIECKLCDYTCIKKASLKSHMKIHKESNIFDCPNCDFTTKNRGSLARHQLLHREDKPHKCSECSYQTAQKAALRAHMQRHKGEKPFKCPDCDYSSVEKTHLIRHSRQHTGEKPIFCFVCDYRCIQFGCLVTHVKRHNDCLMQCAFCHFNTLKSDALIVHLRAEHKRSWGKTPLQCPECSFKCFTKENLKKHTQNHVDLRKNAKQSEIVSDSEKLSQNIFSCKKCDFETSNKKYLKSHKKKEH